MSEWAPAHGSSLLTCGGDPPAQGGLAISGRSSARNGDEVSRMQVRELALPDLARIFASSQRDLVAAEEALELVLRYR